MFIDCKWVDTRWQWTHNCILPDDGTTEPETCRSWCFI